MFRDSSVYQMIHDRFGRCSPAQTTRAAFVRGSAQRYRLSMIVPEERASSLASAGTPDFETMCSLLLPYLPEGTQLSSMRWSSVYSVSHRIASTYGRAGAFIGGNAAHIHPPVGGKGMNGFVNLSRLRWEDGSKGHLSESRGRISGDFGDFAPCDEPCCESFAKE
jgi:hypothetical protein